MGELSSQTSGTAPDGVRKIAEPFTAAKPSAGGRLDVRPLAGSMGAEIFGVDLSKDVDDETFSEIRQAFLNHLMIAFPNQDLAPEDQIRIAGRFGTLMVDSFIKSLPGHPEILEVIKDKHERLVFGASWHSDNTYLERPPLGSFLYSKEVPSYGGDTLFSNQYLAYEALSPGLKKTLDSLVAVHSPWSYNMVIAKGDYYDEKRTMKLRNDDVMKKAMQSSSEHPVVRTHPESGRKALYVNGSYTQKIKDWTEEESQPLLQFLYQHAVQPEFTCRYRWAAGTLAVWDNRCAMHYPINDYHGSRRMMHRVTVEGDRPF
jgi:taurine dioxygenase